MGNEAAIKAGVVPFFRWSFPLLLCLLIKGMKARTLIFAGVSGGGKSTFHLQSGKKFQERVGNRTLSSACPGFPQSMGGAV